MFISKTPDIQAVRDNASDSDPVHPGPYQTVDGKDRTISTHAPDDLLLHQQSVTTVEDDIAPSHKVPARRKPPETFPEFLHPQKAANCATEALLDDSDNPVIPGLRAIEPDVRSFTKYKT